MIYPVAAVHIGWGQAPSLDTENKLVPQGRDQVAKLPLFVRTQTHSLGKSQ